MSDANLNSPQALTQTALTAISQAVTLNDLEDVRLTYLGKKGLVAGLMKTLSSLPAEGRREYGQQVNQCKQDINIALDERLKILQQEALEKRLQSEKLDVTLPAPPSETGSIHPVTQTTLELIEIFGRLGFSIAEGPDIETQDNNFTLLNIPPHHPSRQMHDSFYLPDGHVLRTHTSPVQIRTMSSSKPPLRILAPGKTYRCDSDPTHTPMFHQIEGLVIDQSVTLSHLKGLLQEVCECFFNIPKLEIRLRPSYFPFTQPSVEIDIRCDRSDGKLIIGKGQDWLEILGAGVVHPQVLSNCDIDPAEWQGIAFGIGLDRLAMLKYGISDLRACFEGDIRWLKHYGFPPLTQPSRSQGR